MWIFNALHPYPYYYYGAFLLHRLPAAAGNQSVDGTQFIATESRRQKGKVGRRIFTLMRGYIRQAKESKTRAGPLLLQ
jgi:hypothetical protein